MTPREIRAFNPGWKLSLFTLLLLPLLVSLGFWQLAREQEKLALQGAWEARAAMPPVKLEALAEEEDLQYRRVTLTGRFDNVHAFLLDNRVHQGRPGFEVISPFTTVEGRQVLVNRGWLQAGRDREHLPEIQAVAGEQALTGTVYVPLGEALMLGEESPFAGWPRVLQVADTGRMFRELDVAAEESFPYIVRLAGGAPGALTTDWPVITTAPEKHRAYAVQWFAMAAALFGLFLYASLQRRG